MPAPLWKQIADRSTEGAVQEAIEAEYQEYLSGSTRQSYSLVEIARQLDPNLAPVGTVDRAMAIFNTFQHSGGFTRRVAVRIGLRQSGRRAVA